MSEAESQPENPATAETTAPQYPPGAIGQMCAAISNLGEGVQQNPAVQSIMQNLQKIQNKFSKPSQPAPNNFFKKTLTTLATWMVVPRVMMSIVNTCRIFTQNADLRDAKKDIGNNVKQLLKAINDSQLGETVKQAASNLNQEINAFMQREAQVIRA